MRIPKTQSTSTRDLGSNIQSIYQKTEYQERTETPEQDICNQERKTVTETEIEKEKIK